MFFFFSSQRYATLHLLSVQVFEGVQRVAAVLVEHCSLGNAKYLTWETEYWCGDDRLVEAMERDARQLENDLVEWVDEVHNCREYQWLLNFFTMQQLIVLQRELAAVARHGADALRSIPSQVFMLLETIKPDVSAAEIYRAVVNGLTEQSSGHYGQTGYATHGMSPRTQSYAGVEPMDVTPAGGGDESLAYILSQGFDIRAARASLAVCHGDVKKAIAWAAKFGRDEEKLAAVYKALFDEEIEESPSPTMTQHSAAGVSDLDAEIPMDQGDIPTDLHALMADGQDFLKLVQIGRILMCLARQVRPRPPCPVPKFITPGQPNLLVVSEADVLGTVLDLYRYDQSRPLPTPSQVLVCTPHTTAEEVSLLWRRALADESYHLYCLVNADQLDYSVSSEAMLNFSRYAASNSPAIDQYRLVIVCNRENEDHALIMAALEQCRTVPTPCLPQELRNYLRKQFTALPLQKLQRPDGSPWQPALEVDESKSCVRLVVSERPGVGKSLFVRRLEEKLMKLDGNSAVLQRLQSSRHAEQCSVRVSVPIQGNAVNVDAVLAVLLQHAPDPLKPLSRLVHFDIAPTVCGGLDAFLFNLLVLGSVTDSAGRVWRRRPTDLYVVEVTCPEQAFTSIGLANEFLSEFGFEQSRPNVEHGTPLPFYIFLPAHLCGSPLQALRVQEKKKTPAPNEPQLETLEFQTLPFQRVYAYLQRFMFGSDALDHFKFFAGRTIGDPRQCLIHLMRHCGVQDPSWLVLRNFVHFLDVQLRDCEQSVFCDTNLVGEELSGFRSFVVRLMMRMSKDFATPSMADTSEKEEEDEDDMTRYELRRRWEHDSHPYLFFNHDRSLTFIGFNVTREGNLIDRSTNQVLETGIMTRRLHTGLRAQRVDFNKDFLSWTRAEKLSQLRKVIGQTLDFEPDKSYELTLDNVKKILAIEMRFRCGIPVVIMGETGCGKTRLIRFMCQLQSGKREEGKEKKQNLLMMKVHGGTTEDEVREKVLQAQAIAKRNAQKHNIDTVLFFDEANTSEALGMIKEVMCDGRVRGQVLDRSARLRVIAACNPYRRHTKEMIRRLEEAGLGYHVQADKTVDKLGRIPLRQAGLSCASIAWYVLMYLNRRDNTHCAWTLLFVFLLQWRL